MIVATSFHSVHDYFHHSEVLGPRYRTALGDTHPIALAAFAFLIVRVQLCRPAQQLAVQTVLHLAIDQHGYRFRHFVADHYTL
jgi:hypothetical protein